MTSAPPRIERLTGFDLRVEAGGWPEAEPFRTEIEADFAARQADNPHLWNGRVLLLRGPVITDGVLTGACIETDFAAFTWWRARGIDDLGVKNIFAFAALEGSDGAFVMGRMAAHTASPGRIYFAGGTPDPQDVVDGRLDLRGSALRELAEETGLDPMEAEEHPGWDLVQDGLYFGLMRRLVFPRTGADIARAVADTLSRQVRPELSGMHVILQAQDLIPEVTPFSAAYVRWRWAGGGA